MPTPAEIIAARVNGTYDELYGVSDTESSSFDDDNSTLVSSVSSAVPSISDDAAFPTLKKAGTASTSTGAVSWGPSMKSPAGGNTPVLGASGASNGARSGSSTPKFKFSTIQEAFSLDVNDQVSVTKPELIRILTAIKSETKTNIECTTSQHIKKRTFLITGKADDVKQAKRLVIMKLSKPLTVTFKVPSKLRSRIIGPQGKVLKPIIQANDVKIDIGNDEFADETAGDEDEDDSFSTYVNVTVTGYAEGCAAAEAQILAIIKDETKNLATKIQVPALIKPLVPAALNDVVSKYSSLDISIPDFKSASNNVLIVGDRETAKAAKAEIKQVLSTLEAKVVVEEVPIPKLKHQFLPIETILVEDNVLIKLPEEGETTVKFIGERSRIAGAQQKAKQITSQYKVEVLDMSKAHKGNLQHVRAVASYLNTNGVLKEIANTNDVVINIPDNKTLAKKDITSIPIEIVSKGDEAEKVKNTKKSIVSVVNKITPDQTLVITDIDSFLINKVPETIKEVARENKISWVTLGEYITLFNQVTEPEESEDFDDFSESDNSGFAKVNEALNQLRELAANLKSVVLSVPSNEQTHISGYKGSTLKNILAGAEPNSLVIKLHSNGNESSEDEVYLHGVKSDVEAAKKEIESVLADAKEYADGFTTTIPIPSISLSRLIGKNGANMNALRDEFGVKLDVAEEGDDKEKKTEIVISGSKKNVDLAKTKVQQLTKKWADETLVRLRVESQYHRRMIGPNRIYINRLQDKYNVKIRFPSIDFDGSSTFADAPKSKDEVTIKGPSKGVTKAEEELKELLQFEKENGFKENIKIPTKAIARVIGKAGETINDIADGTGVEYNFKRDNDSEEKLGYAEVELTGSKSGLKEAIKKIQEIIEEIENFTSVTINVDPKYHRELIGAGGSAMKEIITKAGGDDLPRNKYFRLLSIPNEGTGSDEVVSEGPKTIVDKVIKQIKDIISLKEASITEEYELPKEKHRFIVGPSGSIRRALQTEFNATIDIPRPNDDSTIIKLQGLPEKVEALKAKIAELVKDDWNVSIDVPQEFHALVSERGAIFNKLKKEFNVEVQHGNLTRQAAKLSSASIPTPPESAFPQDDEKTKFTIVDNEAVEASAQFIPWRLKGDEKDTEKAAKFIQERLANASGATSIGWLYSKNPSAFSKIIGPQGSKVNQIRKKSSTFITVPRANDKNGNFVYLVGTVENLEIARAEIEKLLN
ncbi:vigilin [Suhomyces tanzawaensis NRRL Y-17324]|uniref:Vigilin n=1 Tax=Suhomyces tanzawaensis NRRL Y-17324 TaxID=984487 RepID=A0A1E4SEH3_9ASCO|nr:vigilin [Suhomyces tanzawaensis NRRL Y-17324]ODV77921.1 vigilin [Suhomyces tanzawaensis NRRL Y-17324]